MISKVKKVLRAAMAAVLCLGIGDVKPMCDLTVSAVSYSDAINYGDLTYQKFDEDEDGIYDYICITDCDESAVSVDIPAEIDGLPVKIIGDLAFEGCSNLESVTIPYGVTSIAYGAFVKCFSLTSVTIPDSVTYIGDGAFFSTALFNNQTGIKYADKWVVDCNLDAITAEIKKGTKSIAEGAFYGCESLESVIIPDSVTSIGAAAFAYCSSLESVTILNSDCEIYDDAETVCNRYKNFALHYSGVIRGYSGSTAQAYAKKYGYMFSAIDGVKVQGDLSGDEIIDFLDLVHLSRLLLPGVNISDERLSLADLNGNGELDFLDLVALSKELLKNANK